MADTGDQLLREVREDLQREQWLRLWQAYGRHAIAGVVLVILVVAGYTGYTEYRHSRLADDGLMFWQADRAAELGESENAAVLFEAIVEDGSGGYPFLAGLREARILAEDGQRDRALALYDRLAAMNGVAERYRQLAALYAVMLLVDDADAADVAARIEPLLQGDWRYPALELKGLLELRAGDSEAAAEAFRAIVEAPDAPPALNARAAELLAISGGGT